MFYRINNLFVNDNITYLLSKKTPKSRSPWAIQQTFSLEILVRGGDKPLDSNKKLHCSVWTGSTRIRWDFSWPFKFALRWPFKFHLCVSMYSASTVYAYLLLKITTFIVFSVNYPSLSINDLSSKLKSVLVLHFVWILIHVDKRTLKV